MTERTKARVQEAAKVVERRDFVWHQRFELAPGVYTPGRNDVDWLLDVAGIPPDLTGTSVLDIGTSNGGAAFTLERRGAERVVAVDVSDERKWGFGALREFLGSRVEFVRSGAYDLERALGGETFDLVVCWGVLYHLRHPLRALDAVRAVARGRVSVESAVSDFVFGPGVSELAAATFHRTEFLGDGSNWFLPTTRGLVDWCSSSGLLSRAVTVWPRERHTRALVDAVRADGPPEHEAWQEWRAGEPDPSPRDALPSVREVDPAPTAA